MTESEEEADENGWRRERQQEMRTGCGFEGRPQASRARGRMVARLRTWIWECGSGDFRVSSWGVRRGGIFGRFKGESEMFGDLEEEER